ncbi:MAG: hypothetical protein LUG51_07420 [Tannerellaceae bacterium]|nr:hypothetical protein [Tannerellaceae bacterium]
MKTDILKTDTLYDNFLNTIKEKIPQKSVLASTLSQILNIEKEAVYRRLRREVPFTFAEVAIIAHYLGISIDFIVGSVSHRSRPFNLKIIDFIDSEEVDFEMSEHFLNIIDSTKEVENTEHASALNMIPASLYLNYDHILRFYIFKWKYQYENGNSLVRFRDIHPSEQLITTMKQTPSIARHATNTFYIWDDRIFEAIVSDIIYFHTIRLITDEEKAQLKKDLLLLLEEIEHLAVTGEFAPGKKVQFYITNVHFETSYAYIDGIRHKMSIIKAFTMNEVISTDLVAFELVKKWMQSMKRTSTLISESGEMQRTLFFNKQREIIDQL